jgi:hypothetical protein
MSEQELTRNDGLEIDVHEDVPLAERLKGKYRRSGTKGPAGDLDARDEIDRDSGRMTWREQLYDRQTDYYQESATFKDTGELKFRKAGRLSEKEAIEKAFRHYRELIARLAPQPQ